MGIKGYFLHTSSPRIFCLQNKSLQELAAAEILLLTRRLPHCGQSPGCLFIICTAFWAASKCRCLSRGGSTYCFFCYMPLNHPNLPTPGRATIQRWWRALAVETSLTTKATSTSLFFQDPLPAKTFSFLSWFHTIAIKSRNYYLRPFFFFFFFEGSEVKGQR